MGLLHIAVIFVMKLVGIDVMINIAYARLVLHAYFKLFHSGELHDHQMEIFYALLAFCAGNSPFTGEFSS